MSVEDRKREQQEALLQELAMMPIIGAAVKNVGINRSTYYRWREEDGGFEEKADLALAKGHEKINDLAESRLIAQVSDGERWAIQYWLGRHHYRYIGKPEAPLPFRRPVSRMSLFKQFWK